MKKDGQYVGIQDEYVPENDGYVENNINRKIKSEKNLRYAKRFGIGYFIFFILIKICFLK